MTLFLERCEIKYLHIPDWKPMASQSNNPTKVQPGEPLIYWGTYRTISDRLLIGTRFLKDFCITENPPQHRQ